MKRLVIAGCVLLTALTLSLASVADVNCAFDEAWQAVMAEVRANVGWGGELIMVQDHYNEDAGHETTLVWVMEHAIVPDPERECHLWVVYCQSGCIDTRIVIDMGLTPYPIGDLPIDESRLIPWDDAVTKLPFGFFVVRTTLVWHYEPFQPSPKEPWYFFYNAAGAEHIVGAWSGVVYK